MFDWFVLSTNKTNNEVFVRQSMRFVGLRLTQPMFKYFPRARDSTYSTHLYDISERISRSHFRIRWCLYVRVVCWIFCEGGT